ncbi:sortilin-related receptor-like [Malaya genurostris]|uniref:sortilin-related receptor-like n=1 Tax=Malaya genurostris TaxID=325434 RepID=UPI0026F3F659|nr:sortilin-related receptor-like [Malaya genurostris]
MARLRCWCSIGLTMMLMNLLGYIGAHSVRHGFPPDILHVNYDDDTLVRQPFTINSVNEWDAVESEVATRFKRSPVGTSSGSSTTGSDSSTSSVTSSSSLLKESKNSLPQVIEAKVNELKDSHAQLIVHWLGEGTSVMICLAREPPADNDAKAPPPQPSRIFVSKDYGDTFDDQTEMFALNINGSIVNSTVEQFFTHPKFNTIVFTDPRNKAIFTSEDYGKSVTVRMLNFTPSDVTFYEADTKMILILDKKDPERKLYYTTDFGASFSLLQSYVKSYIWSSGEGVPIHLYVERKEPTNTSSVIFYNASNLRNNSNVFNVLIEKVEDFHIKKDFMFASQRLPNNTQLLISYKRGKFVKADFQTELDMKGYHVADVDGRRIMISVVHTERISHLYVSESNADMTDIKFVPSLENVFTYIPDLNWRSSWLVHSSDGAFTDLHKVEGLRGIYIASKINRIPLGETISPDSLVSLITFDHGASWRSITAPTTDDDGQPIQNCVKDCSLHLSQKFSSLYPVTRSVGIMSSKAAPGVIMASGVVGKSLKGHPGVYISRDAGLTWKQILKDYHFFNMGDHGGILVAVKYFKSKGETNNILYSTDEGEKWMSTPFHGTNLKVYGLMTEPDTNTTIFTLFGSEQEEHKWLIIKLDLKKAFTSNCTEDDYKFWAPGTTSGDSFVPCILGLQDTYQRRKPHANCYNGIDYERPIRQQVCSCNGWDFECDFGFSRSGNKNSPCVRNKTIENYDPYAAPSSCKPGQFFNRTKGYRKIEGDVCVDGYSSQYSPQLIPCPMEEVNEFLVIAQRDKISRINLGNLTREVLPVSGLKNVIAIEFDKKHNCVFWADIMTDVIGRQCLNGDQAPELLVDSSLSSVEGMSYDWVSEMLYFVDGMRLKIEAVKTSVGPLGRMRRTIIDAPNLNKPRGIVVHPLQGFLFWTDWNALRPSVSRANLDGSDVKVLFTKPDVVWPNGVTIDYMAERLYWVDASKDYIASSDLNGKNFINILQQDSRVAHPFAVAVLKDLMYWDDWKMNSVYSADKDHGIMINIIAEEMMNSMDLKVYGHSIQEGTNACSEGNKCSHICVGAPKGYSCLCPDGMEKNAQGQCLCPGGVTPFANNTCARSGSTCGSKFFDCKNSVCVPLIYKCDGDDDCGDRSDEEGCPSDKPPCPPYMFTCKSDKQCVPKYFVCDFDRDCLDGSDEQNCQPASCKSDEYTCGNGRCINKSWLCDGEDDCRDGTDERTCHKNSTTVVECKQDEFRCNGTNTCIPKQWRCDTEHDCNDGSDEFNCTKKECEVWMFMCESDMRCIYKTWQCDGEKDCKDGSDEKNCSASTEVPRKPGINFLPGDSCHDWMFKCANDKCVPYWWKCDDVNDCGDGSDEAGCNSTQTISSTTHKPIPTRKKERNCGLHEFRCDTGVCISKRFVCDGYEDCTKGEDEGNCPSQKQCSVKHFKCRSDGMCLPMEKYCNNVVDCADGSDEDCKFKPNSSSTISNNCTNNPGVFACDNTCFALMVQCDGKSDCYDGTDEEHCEKMKTKHYQVTQIGVDERSLNSTSFLIFWWIPLPQDVRFEFLPSIYYNGEWKNVSNWIDQTDYRFTNLKPYTLYNVTTYVRVKNQTKITPPYIYYEIATSEGIPSVPLNVSVVQINGSRIQVSWQVPKEVNGQLQGYTINYRSQSKNVGPAQNVKVGASETSVIIETEFKPDIVYEFWVKARNGKHESISSNMVQLKFDGTSNIEKISKIDVVNITKKSVTLEWKPVSNADGYMIQPILPQSYPLLNTIWVKNSTVTLDNMVPGTQYVIKVAAYVKQYVGRHETTIVSFGGDPLPAVNLRLKEQAHDYSLIEWDAPEGSFGKLTYGIYYGTNMDQLFDASKINTTATSYKLMKLRPCESYLVSVGIVGPIGPGPLGRNPLKLDTPYNNTLPPKELTVDISETSQIYSEMIIQWKHSCSLESSSYPNYIISVRELTKNKTSLVNVKSSTNKTLVHVFRSIPRGAAYEIAVSTDIPNAQVVTTVAYSAPLPAPVRLQVWPEANGTYVVYWKPVIDFKEIKFIYQAVVYEGRGVNTTIPPLLIIEAKEPPILINPDRLSSLTIDSLFTIGVRLKTADGFFSDIVETESFSKHNFEGLVQESSFSYAWLWIIPTIIAMVLALTVVYVVQRHRRLQNSFSRFANSHYDTRTGATRIGDSLDDDEHEHQEVPRSFSDDEPLVIA